MGSSSPLQHSKNLPHHILRAQQHVIIPKAQHAVAFALENRAAPLVVVDRIEMLPSIQLDHQPCRHADEIHDVAGQWILTTERAATDLSQPQVMPQPTFRIGAPMTQPAGADPLKVPGESSCLR